MTDVVLRNKPLVEAIFELRWCLDQKAPGIQVDPHYKLLIGRIFDRVSNEYSDHQQLPAATMPDEFAAYVVQHQFRKPEKGWPLIQLGPGIITLNDTEGYLWSDFKGRISKFLDVLFEVYPNSAEGLRPKGLLLRYIDAIDFEFDHDNVFDFIKDHLKTTIKAHEKLFENTGVDRLPLGFDLRFLFPSSRPRGSAHLRFARGKKNNKDALIWETQIQSLGKDVPGSREDIKSWVDDSHKLTHDWFFKMIEGELLERFR